MGEESIEGRKERIDDEWANFVANVRNVSRCSLECWLVAVVVVVVIPSPLLPFTQTFIFLSSGFVN